MRLLVLDAAMARCAVGVVADGIVMASRAAFGGRGHSAALAPMLAEAMAEAEIRAEELDGVAVVVGPGSFTGLRASIALAHGVAAACGISVVGVTVAEALAASLPDLRGRSLWVAIHSRRDRVFLHRAGRIGPSPLDALPQAGGKVAVAGNAAIAVAARLAARGDDVWLTDARFPGLVDIAAVGARRLQGDLEWLDAQPLYVDPPEAKLPAAGLRPPPAP